MSSVWETLLFFVKSTSCLQHIFYPCPFQCVTQVVVSPHWPTLGTVGSGTVAIIGRLFTCLCLDHCDTQIPSVTVLLTLLGCVASVDFCVSYSGVVKLHITILHV